MELNYQILGSCDNAEIRTAELHKELVSHSVQNTVILAQEAAGTRSVRPLTPSEAECNQSRHVQYSLRHCVPFFPASSKLLPVTSHPGEAPAADYPCWALQALQLSTKTMDCLPHKSVGNLKPNTAIPLWFELFLFFSPFFLLKTFFQCFLLLLKIMVFNAN